MAKKIILYAILVILSISLTSCQTVQGIGGDIQWTAERTARLWERGTAEEEWEMEEQYETEEEYAEY